MYLFLLELQEGPYCHGMVKIDKFNLLISVGEFGQNIEERKILSDPCNLVTCKYYSNKQKRIMFKEMESLPT